MLGKIKPCESITQTSNTVPTKLKSEAKSQRSASHAIKRSHSKTKTENK